MHSHECTDTKRKSLFVDVVTNDYMYHNVVILNWRSLSRVVENSNETLSVKQGNMSEWTN